MEWYLKVLRQYADFEGRARRQEYWMFALINFIITMIPYALGIAFADSSFGMIFMAIYFIYSLAVLIPGLAVAVRRLHDIDKSGWFLLIALIPIVGFIILLVWLATDGTRGRNRFGSDPKSTSGGGFDDSDILDAGL